MHYYQFNIGDYASHTAHLDELEDLAYRRMIDYCYLNEIGLPESVEEIARLIRMRTHCERIANVLREFFQQDDAGWWHCPRVEKKIAAFRSKSDKAATAARKRWEKSYANALPTHSERNANHKPLTNNHKPVTKNQLDYSCWPQLPTQQTLSDWLEMRKRLKANVSQTVINRFASELQKAVDCGYTVDSCLQECVTRNWRGFEFQWILNSGVSYANNQSTARNRRPTRSESIDRAFEEAFGAFDGGAIEGDFTKVVSDGSHDYQR